MTDKAHAPNRIAAFFLIAYAFSWLFWIPQALAANGLAIPQGLAAFLSSPLNVAAFGPLVAALILSFADGGWKAVGALLKRGVDFRFRKVWLIPIVLVPLVIFAGGVLLSVAVGATPLDTSVLSNPPFAIIAIVAILLTGGPLQEEFGWRGYALPRLQGRFNALAASLILGILWWLWHLPLAFIPGRFMASGVGLFLALAPEIILTSVLFTWVYNNTGGSVLAALLFHTFMNWSIWLVLPGMQVNLAIIGFTVLLLAVAVAVVVARWGAARLSR
ncbi:MAG: type II CAAX endopeptidase family protein [Anaerolineae bacterium]|nr:type II CAAX endopeptidase family protein [Anaerolineae bacterium]